MDSILVSIKKLLGIAPDYLVFDVDIIIGINSALMVLNQLGIGPENGFRILGETETWQEFLGDREDLELVKSYVYCKVKMLFDPPQNGAVKEAMQNAINEFEWRLEVQASGIN